MTEDVSKHFRVITLLTVFAESSFYSVFSVHLDVAINAIFWRLSCCFSYHYL